MGRVSRKVNAQQIQAGRVRKPRTQNGKAYEAHQPNNGKRSRSAFKKPTGADQIKAIQEILKLRDRNVEIIAAINSLRAEYEKNERRTARLASRYPIKLEATEE
jgi:hypothetical protein